jgi:sugar phosphate isomerase/epimerase
MWSVTKESPDRMYQILQKYIFHTHIKDAQVSAEGEKYRLLGEGNAPVREAIQALKRGAYSGYYSFEWEKLWHPEIEDPEVAIPHFSQKFTQFWL